MTHSPGFEKLVADARARIQEIDVDGLKAQLETNPELRLVDVREAEEYAAGRIAGSVSLPRGILERDVERAFPDQAATLILICGGGFRSAMAAENLQKMGYQNVISVWGGFRGWKDAGYPVES